MTVQRYTVRINRLDGYAIARIEKDEEGAWIKYEDHLKEMKERDDFITQEIQVHERIWNEKHAIILELEHKNFKLKKLLDN